MDAMVRWLDGGGWICFWRGTEIFLLGSGWIFHEGTHIMVPLLLQVQDLAATTSHLAIRAESSAIFHIAYHRWIFIRLMYGTPRDTYATIEHPAPAVPMNL